jgi:hypothetical protein
VADQVFIGVDDGAEGADLTRCLGRHGLSAALVRDGARWRVEVRSLGEDPRSFFADLGVALANWNRTGGGRVARLSAAPRLEASARVAEALRGGGHAREEALFWLRAHLAAAAHFEFGRRGITGDGVQRQDAARLVSNASEAALAAVLADLGRYRGQSAFATWTAKYAIHEAATAARKELASRAPAEGSGPLRERPRRST